MYVTCRGPRQHISAVQEACTIFWLLALSGVWWRRHIAEPRRIQAPRPITSRHFLALDHQIEFNSYFLLIIPTTLAGYVMQSIVFVRPFVCFILTFESIGVWPWYFARVWATTVARQRLKVNVIDQGQGLGLARMVTGSARPRSSIEGSLLSGMWYSFMQSIAIHKTHMRTKNRSISLELTKSPRSRSSVGLEKRHIAFPTPSMSSFYQFSVEFYTIRYDTRCYFNVRSKAGMSQLNLPPGNNN